MKKFRLLFALPLLAACAGNDVKETLGMKIDAPDEFAVERKPKLDVPPSFKLRPPAPGEAPVNAVETRDLVKQQVTGTNATVSAETESEKSFLTKLGAGSASPDIRSTLTKEYPETAELTTLEKIRSISDDNVGNILVDPEKEKERLETNKKENKPVTEGETPTMSINDGKSVIDKILD